MRAYIPSTPAKLLTDLTDKYTVYLLGLLWADGHFTFSGSGAVNIACVNDDSDVIKRICSKHGVTHWKTKQAMRHGKTWGRLQFKLYLPMRDLRRQLLEWGFETKTCPRKLLDTIPERLRHYWWRGYFDGDGCFYAGKKKTELAFWSTIDQNWSFVHALFRELGESDAIRTIQYSRKEGRHCSSATATYTQRSIRTFLRYIYQGDDISEVGFLRKHAKAAVLLSNPSDRMVQGGKAKKSRYQYVTWVESKGKWRAFIYRLGKVRLGEHKTEEEAHAVVQKYLAEHDIPKPRKDSKTLVYHLKK